MLEVVQGIRRVLGAGDAQCTVSAGACAQYAGKP
jgi:hypothetical protein